VGGGDTSGEWLVDSRSTTGVSGGSRMVRQTGRIFQIRVSVTL